VALSTKLLVPALQGICYHFLLSHASGKPIVALALAEEYGHADLFREASRFVLDQRESGVGQLVREAYGERGVLIISFVG
jgi:hypothetical protein